MFGVEPGPDIRPLVAGRIDEDLIAAHWDDVLRLGTSIRTGFVSASIILERLGSYPRANGLALALREIGRVERTLFTLDWIAQPEQRRRRASKTLAYIWPRSMYRPLPVREPQRDAL